MSVELRCDCASARRYAHALKTDAARMLRELRLDVAELSVVITSDRAILALNRKYRKKDEPTDVLSFPLLADSGARRRIRARDARNLALGDIVISIDTARRQALELGVPLKERLRALLIHGCLHLIGYDHERSPAAARRMFAKERALAMMLAQNHRRSQPA